MIETSIHREQPISPDVQKPRYDALLVHGYWMTDKTIRNHQKDGTISERHITSPALRTHFAARAAALAWNNARGAGKIVIDLGHLWGPDYPSEGKVMADTLVNKYHVSKEAIILREQAYSTYGEVGSFLELAKQNNWTNVLDVAFGAHRKTIRETYRNKDYEELKRGVSVDYESVEDILSHDDVRIRRKLTGLGRSKYGRGYQLYEGLKRARMYMPKFDYKKLEQINKDTRTEPGELPFKGLRIDKYKLPPKEESEAA